ncbi:Uncharacterised protein [Mycobacterium tuberculosis]|nr:Uncharacterised protein [Mycobacterium tuberculosis]
MRSRTFALCAFISGVITKWPPKALRYPGAYCGSGSTWRSQLYGLRRRHSRG